MTIKQLAQDYKQQLQYYNECETVDVTFEAGANAALKEIELFVERWSFHDFGHRFINADNLVNFIDRLKGR